MSDVSSSTIEHGTIGSDSREQITDNTGQIRQDAEQPLNQPPAEAATVEVPQSVVREPVQTEAQIPIEHQDQPTDRQVRKDGAVVPDFTPPDLPAETAQAVSSLSPVAETPASPPKESWVSKLMKGAVSLSAVTSGLEESGEADAAQAIQFQQDVQQTRENVEGGDQTLSK